MKLKNTFVITKVAGETICVPMSGDFHGIIKLNSTGAFIIECLKEETTPDAIVEKLLHTYDVEKVQAENDVGGIIFRLREIGALEE